MARQRHLKVLLILIGGSLSASVVFIKLSSARARQQRLLIQVKAALDDYDFPEARRLLDGAEPTAERAFLSAQLARRSHPEDFVTAHHQLDEATRQGLAADRIRFEKLLLSCQEHGPSPALRENLCARASSRPDAAPQIYEALVRGSLRDRDFQGGMEILDRWLGEHPDDWRGHLWRGAVFEHSGLSELSIPAYQSVLESRPEEVRARRRLGLVLAATGFDYESALEYLNSCGDAAGDADVLVARALCLRALADVEKSRRLTEEALEINPDHYRGLQHLALLKLHNQENEAVLEIVNRLERHARTNPDEALQRLLRLDPVAFYTHDTQSVGETLHLKATVLQRLGRESEAEACRRELVVLQDSTSEIKRLLRQSESGDPLVWYRLGELYAKYGFNGDARHWLMRVLEVEPENAQAREALLQLKPANGSAQP